MGDFSPELCIFGRKFSVVIYTRSCGPPDMARRALRMLARSSGFQPQANSAWPSLRGYAQWVPAKAAT